MDDENSKRVPQVKEKQAPKQPDSKPQCAETPSAVIPPKSNEPPTPRHQCRKRYKSIKEEIKYWFEVVAIIGGLVGLVLIWVQYRDMTRATDASVNQSKALVAQSGIMQRQLEEMKGARELDERAWVYVVLRDNSLEVTSNQCFVVAHLQNSGRTPAFMTGNYEGLTFNTNDIKISDPLITGMSPSLNPGADFRFPIMVTDIQRTFLATGSILYFYGTVYYTDIFGEKHWTQFCISLSNGGKDMTVMPFHNSCDDAQNN